LIESAQAVGDHVSLVEMNEIAGNLIYQSLPGIHYFSFKFLRKRVTFAASREIFLEDVRADCHLIRVTPAPEIDPESIVNLFKKLI